MTHVSLKRVRKLGKIDFTGVVTIEEAKKLSSKAVLMTHFLELEGTLRVIRVDNRIVHMTNCTHLWVAFKGHSDPLSDDGLLNHPVSRIFVEELTKSRVIFLTRRTVFVW